MQDVQLTLAFDPEPSADLAEAGARPRTARARSRDAVAAALIRRNVYATPRERQAVAGRDSLPDPLVYEIAKSIRERSEALEPDAIKDALAVSLGIPREVVDELALSADEGSAIWLDIDRGCIHHDYSRILGVQAARARDPDHYRRSTWSHAKPLALYLASALRNVRASVPHARRIGTLLRGSALSGASAIVDLGGYKLRATMARFQAALPVLMLDAGIDRLEAASVTGGAVHLLPRSRIYYSQTTPERLHHAYETLYQILDWGEPTPRVDVSPVGSATVPTPGAVKRVHDTLQRRLWRRPPRGGRLRTLMRFHNRFIAAAGLALTFCIGARAMKRIAISARYWRPGIDHVEFDDKQNEADLRMDVALCRVARDTVVNVYAHLRELQQRLTAHRGRVPRQWTAYVEAAVRHDDVPLLMRFSQRRARPLAVADLRVAVGERRSEGNWGRKFWQTELLLRGLSTEDITVFARHIVPGEESGSSTQIESRWAIQRRITRVQDGVLGELGVVAPRGLADAVDRDPAFGPLVSTRLRSFKDDARRTLVSVGLGTGVSDMFVDRLVLAALRGSLCPRTSSGYALFLLVFEGITSIDDLERAYAAMGSAYRDRDAEAIEWLDADGRVQRRHLSAPLIIALDKGAGSAPFERAQSQLLSGIAQIARKRVELPALLEAARTRFASVLPGDLAAHVNGLEPLTAVDRRCLVRWRTGHALAKRTAKDEPQTAIPRSLRARLANAVFAKVGRTDQALAREFCGALVSACRRRGRGSEHAQRMEMLADLDKESATAVVLGGWFAAVFDWLLGLVAIGTLRTSPFAPSSLADYAGPFVFVVLDVLASIDIDDMQNVDWADVRRRVLDLAEDRQGHVSAAFTAFHEYLVVNHGVAPRRWPRDSEGEPYLPRSELVSPAEMADIQRHLDQHASDSRFAHQVGAVFGQGSSCAMREQDWRRCLEEGVDWYRGQWYVTLDPHPEPDDGKTPDARRTAKLIAGAGADAFGTWIHRRRSEKAARHDLVFADPADPSKAFEPGATAQALNDLLKQRTGEPLVSLHSLRHTFISLARLRVKTQREWHEVSVRAGHASDFETQRTYMHLYEQLLRRHLGEWLSSFDLSEAEVCSIAGIPPGLLRQRWHRHKAKPRSEVSWALIRERAAEVRLPSVESGIATAEHVLDAHDHTAHVTLSTVIAWLRDRCAGAEDDVIVLRHDVDKQTLERGYRWMRHWHRRHGDRGVLASALPLAPPPTPFADGMKRLGQPKLAQMLDYLTRADRNVVEAWVEAWLNVREGDAIALSNTDDALLFLGSLRTAGVNGDQLVVFHTEQATKIAQNLTTAVSDDDGRAPAIVKCQARSERAEIYLGLRAVHESSVAPAALSIKGLNALLFCAWLFIRLADHEGTP